jgi:ABC-type polysaccharide/polyol phosphate transport system ATPase subunit
MTHDGVDGGGAPVMVHAENVHKDYRLGELSSLGLTMRRLAGRLATHGQAPFTALEDVSFEINSGDAFAIVGRNGSGKSTMLNLICGITVPTRGMIIVRGRLLPLLAIGSSFHPELTGRENIVLFGTLLGLKRDVVRAQVDDIAAFAEIEVHLDTPNKRYSDGMQARLSFAIAMLFPADVYVFDEVLAVVDGEFRDRCLTEIERMRERGKTVIFVSHDLNQVKRLCNRAVWLDRGQVRALGAAAEILPAYERELKHAA